MALNRVKKIAAQREDELIKFHCAGALERMLDEIVVSAGGEEGVGRSTAILEKMLMAKSQSVKQTKPCSKEPSSSWQ